MAAGSTRMSKMMAKLRRTTRRSNKNKKDHMNHQLSTSTIASNQTCASAASASSSPSGRTATSTAAASASSPPVITAAHTLCRGFVTDQPTNEDDCSTGSTTQESVLILHTAATTTTTTTPTASSQQQQQPRWSSGALERTAQLWRLDAAAQEELRRLGAALGDVDHAKNDPTTVLRFLRARSGDRAAAALMFRRMVDWRRAHGVDDILRDYRPPPELVDHFPGAVLEGRDVDGDPIYLSRTGCADMAAMLDRYGRDEMIRQAIWVRELTSGGAWLDRYERERGRPPQRIVIIEDVGGLNLWQFVKNKPLLALYGEIMRLDQDNYPESAKKLLIVRVPVIFKAVWSIAKQFFDPGVVEKMTFMGKNYSAELSQYLDLAVLPDCMAPGVGKGKAEEGLPPNFHGGPLPPAPK